MCCSFLLRIMDRRWVRTLRENWASACLYLYILVRFYGQVENERSWHTTLNSKSRTMSKNGVSGRNGHPEPFRNSLWRHQKYDPELRFLHHGYFQPKAQPNHRSGMAIWGATSPFWQCPPEIPDGPLLAGVQEFTFDNFDPEQFVIIREMAPIPKRFTPSVSKRSLHFVAGDLSQDLMRILRQ